MKLRFACVVGLLSILLCPAQLTVAQTPTQTASALPRLVRFSGTVKDLDGNPLTGVVGITFALYSEQTGGAALWLETQNVTADDNGHYTVLLGATKPEGLPEELFTSEQAHWVGVQASGQAEQPRVLLVSAPYALKAGDAETVGGLPPSAFVLAAPIGGNGAASAPSGSGGNNNAPNVGGGGTQDFIPLWTDSNGDLGNSILYQSGTTEVGIGTTTPAATLDVNGGVIARGPLQLPSTGTATATQGYDSQAMEMAASVFSSGTGTAVPQNFQWQAEPVNNDKSNASGTLNLLFAQGANPPAETGLNIASTGLINFAKGQSFPGTGTITGVTAGTGLSGGGTSGNVTLKINTTFANQFYAQLGAANTFTKNQTVNATMTATSFSGNGAALTNVNAASLNGLASSAFSQLGLSNSYQSSPLGTAIPQVLGPVNNATTSGGFNSNPLDLAASAYSSTSKAAQTETFRWQTEPVGNNTSSPAGELNLLFGANGAPPTETGLSVASNGQITFATGQAFPGTGSGTVTSVGSGAGLTGGPITTSGTLSIAPGGVTNAMLANSSLTVTAGTDLTGGGSVALGSSTTLNLDTTKVPQLNTANTFTGNQAVNGNLSATGVVTGSSYQIGSNLFAFGSYLGGNAFLGFAGNSTMTGPANTAVGVSAFANNTIGQYNTAVGIVALSSNTTADSNTAVGDAALEYTTTGGGNTAVGAAALEVNTTGGLNTALGYFALSLNTTGNNNTATGTNALFSSSTGSNNVATGYGALYSNTTGSDNTATGYQALAGNSSGGANTAIGEDALQANTTGTDNVASGNAALAANTTGVDNTASGVGALSTNTTGNDNVASGIFALLTNNGSDNTGIGTNALRNNTTGSQNTALGMDALQSNTTGSDLTCVGFNCTTTDPNLHNATAIGAHATVGVSDALILGGTGAYAVKVGIGTTTPSNVLTIAQGAGHPLSDGWTTYSSRRWKTNIQTLHGALAKVEQLRGVSYDLKDSGKHEVGVIAEEVGAVVPEVVSYEENGKDARGVDYSRLTALLIEATKEQQRELAHALRQIKQQQTLLKAQAAAMQSLKNEVRDTRETLRKVKAQVADAQPTWVVAKR